MHRIGIALVLVLVTVGLLEATLLRKELLSGGILATFFYPHYGALAEQLASGALPRWNPSLGNGGSFFGPRAGGVVYPPNGLFALLPLGRAMAVFVALHVVLALEGTRRLARELGGGARVALASGFAYGLGGYCVSMIGNPVFLVSAAWLPWAALGGAWLARGRRLGVTLVGSALGLCFLAGEPQGALIAALAAVGLALSGRDHRRRALGLVGAAVVLGTLAGALTVVSSLVILPSTDRALAGWVDEEIGLGAVPTLLDLFVPGVVGFQADARGGYWGSRLGATNLWCVLSVGTLGLAAAFAGAEQKGRVARLGVGLVVAGALLALVDAGRPLSLRFPSKWLVLTALGLALLVGPGLRALAQPTGARIGLGRGWLLGCAVLGPLTGAGLLLWSGGDAWFAAGDPERVVGTTARLTAASSLLRAGVVAGLALLLLHRRPRGRLGSALLLGLLLLDLLTVSKPHVVTTAVDLLEPPPLAATAERAARGPLPRLDPRGEALRRDYRVPPEVEVRTRLEVSQLFYRDVLWSNRGTLSGVRTVRAFETSGSRARAALRAAGSESLALPQRAAVVDAELVLVDRDEYARLSAVDRSQLKLVQAASPSVPQVVLARNLACPPWARLVLAARRADSLEAAAEAVCAEPGALVLGPELGDPAPGAVAGGEAGTVETVSFAPERVELRVEARQACWLVVREAYSEDWEATLDGERVAMARADVLYRAVRIPAGTHAVAMTHAPAWWTPALLLTCLGWLALGACALSVRASRVRPQHHGELA